MVKTIQEAITSDSKVDIEEALKHSVDYYRKTTGSYFNITTAGTVAALGTLGYLFKNDLQVGIATVARGVAIEAGIWGVGRLGYECYQQCKDYHNANIGKNFTDSMNALRAAELKSFGKLSNSVKYLGTLEEEIITEGNRLFPNLEIMEQKLLASKILREEIFRNRDNRTEVLERSAKLIENFNAWRDIQKGREFPGVAQLVAGYTASIYSLVIGAEASGLEISRAAKGIMLGLSFPTGTIIGSALPAIGSKTSYQSGLNASAPMPDPKPTNTAPTPNPKSKAETEAVRPTNLRTIAEVVPPYFEQYGVTDKKEQVALVLKMEEEFPKRHPGKRSIPIKPEGIELITGVIEEYLKEKNITNVVTEEIKVELAKTVPDTIKEVEVPEEDLESNKSLSGNSESPSESTASTPPTRQRRSKLEVARDELVELVDAARREKAERLAAQRRAEDEAKLAVKLNHVDTVTPGEKPNPHAKHTGFVAELRKEQLGKRRRGQSIAD